MESVSCLTASIKWEVLKCKEESLGDFAIGCALDLSELTVKTVWKRKIKSRCALKHGTSYFDDLSHMWNEKLIKTERFLAL